MSETPENFSPENKEILFGNIGSIDDLMDRMNEIGGVVDSAGRLQDAEFARNVLSEFFTARMNKVPEDVTDNILAKITRQKGLREAVLNILDKMGLRQREGAPKVEIKDAKNFDELFSIIRDKKVIRGSREYTSEDMIKRINEAIQVVSFQQIEPDTADIEFVEHFVLGYITNGEGLRDAVRRILLGENYVRRFEREVGKRNEARGRGQNNNESGSEQENRIKNLSVLGLPANASSEDIRNRFRELIRKFHPDMAKNATDVEMFTRQTQEIVSAYDKLR